MHSSPTTLVQLRDRHLELSRAFAQDADATGDECEREFLLSKSAEAAAGAAYFAELIASGATKVPKRRLAA